MLIKMALYELKLSGAEFRSKLAGVLREIVYFPTKGDLDVCIQLADNQDGT